MRFQSKKQAAAYRKYRAIRGAYCEEFPQCMWCNVRGTAVHEILNGPYRMKAFGEPATWLALCSVCNCDVFTDKLAWPWERQLALKFLIDPTRMDLEKVGGILSPRRIDTQAVAGYIESLKRSFR